MTIKKYESVDVEPGFQFCVYSKQGNRKTLVVGYNIKSLADKLCDFLNKKLVNQTNPLYVGASVNSIKYLVIKEPFEQY